MDTEEEKAAIRRLYEAEQSGNWGVLDEVMVPDYVHHDPALPPDLQRGRESYKQATAMFLKAFPDLAGTLENEIAEGDKVVARMTWRGTHEGELMGIPATGRKVNLAFMSIHRLAHGQAVEDWVNFDALGMMQQLGVIPAPGPAGG